MGEMAQTGVEVRYVYHILFVKAVVTNYLKEAHGPTVAVRNLSIPQHP